MSRQQLLSVLLVLLSVRVAPQLLVRLFVKAYPRGDLRAKEMIGEVYRIRPRQRLGWALEQAELAWFEGLAARRLLREEKRELEAGLVNRQRQAVLEEERRQEEADFDAFLRGIRPTLPPRHAAPRRMRDALLPAVLLASAGAGLGGLGVADSGAAPTLTLLPTWAPSLHAAVSVAAAVVLLAAAVSAHAARAGLLRLPMARAAHGRWRPPTLIRTARAAAIAVVVDQGGSSTEGLALAWGGGRVLVALPTGRSWTPATRVRRGQAA